MSFTRQLEANVLNHVFRNQTMPSPTDVYVALFTSTSSEVGGGGYSRQKVTFSEPIADGDGTIIANELEVRFPIALGPWGEIKHVSVFDSLSGGLELDSGTLSVPKTIDEDEQLIFPVGNVTIKLD